MDNQQEDIKEKLDWLSQQIEKAEKKYEQVHDGYDFAYYEGLCKGLKIAWKLFAIGKKEEVK